MHMRDRMRAKLRGNAGETIGETLVALLISALALVMLAGAISSASKIVLDSKAAMAEYYAGDSAMESSGTDTITIADESGNTVFSAPVSCRYNKKSGETTPVISYEKL